MNPKEYFKQVCEEKREWIYASAAISLNNKLVAGGGADKEFHRLLSESSDTTVFGANTFRESASEPDGYPDRVIAILSRSLDIDAEHSLFKKDKEAFIYTESGDQEKIRSLKQNNSLLKIKQGIWTPEAIVEDLRDEGKQKILIDGGGQTYNFFVPSIKDWFLTLVPIFASDHKPDFWNSGKKNLELIWSKQYDGRVFTRLSS